VDALRELTDAPIPAQAGMGALMQDVIRTKHRSRTQLKLIDGSMLNMGPDYMMEINKYVFDANKKVRSGVIEVLRGKVRATVAKIGSGGKNSRFEIHTPTAIAAARGTQFIVNVDSSLMSEIVVLKGIVAVRNVDPLVKGEVLVTAGQYTQVAHGQPPAAPANMPLEQVQLLVNETSTNGSGSSEPLAGEQTVTAVEVAPVPQPPVLIPHPKPKSRPILVQGKPIGTGLPPVQPPVTTTVPALLTVPVSLVLVF